MGTIKEDAEALRVGLLTGLVDAQAVVAWADRVILDNRIAEAPVVLDLAVSGRESIGDLVSLLSTVPGDADQRAVGRRIAGQLQQLLAARQLKVVPVARVMHRLLREGYSPDGEFETMAYYADDGVDLAQRGIFGTLEEVESEIATFLERYKPDADGRPRPAA